MTPRPPLFQATAPEPESVFDLRPLLPIYECSARLSNSRHLSILTADELLGASTSSQGSNMRWLLFVSWADVPVGPFTQHNAVSLFDLLHGAER